MSGKNYEVVFTKPNVVELVESKIPEPGPGEVLVQTRMTAISTGTELSLLTGDGKPEGSVWERISKYPRKPGYNNIGTVVKSGSSSGRELLGRRVSGTGPHASYWVTGADRVGIVPENVETRHAVFFTFAVIIMNGVRRSGLKFGESAAVYGAGLLGQLTARVCRICGALPVIVIDASGSRLAAVPGEKGFVRLNPLEGDIVPAASEATDSRMCDVVFELTGNAGVIPEEFNLLRRQGRFVVLSSPLGRTLFDFHDLCNSPSYTIIGAHNASHPKHAGEDNPWTAERDEKLFYDFLEAGYLSVEELISHREPCTRAVELYKMLVEDRTKAMGVLLDWETG